MTARQVILSVCLWLLGAVPLVYSASWIVNAFVLGQGLALVPAAVLIPVPLVFVVVRLLRFGTIYLSNVRLERQGIIGRVGVDWTDVKGSRFVKRRKQRGGTITVLVVERRSGNDMELGAIDPNDAKSLLMWAIEAAARGDVATIDDRVRREGTVLSNLRLVVVQSLTALVIIVAIAFALVPGAQRKSLERQLDAFQELPPAEQIARAPELLSHPAADQHTPCTVGRVVMYAHIELGDIPSAAARCAENESAGCTGPAGGCEAHFTLIRLREQVQEQGADSLANAADELEVLERSQTAEAFGLRMQILRAMGNEAEAQRIGQECLAAYSHLPPDHDILAPCRAAD